MISSDDKSPFGDSVVLDILIHTGNILNIGEIKKTAGQNATDEILASINSTLNNNTNNRDVDSTAIVDGITSSSSTAGINIVNAAIDGLKLAADQVMVDVGCSSQNLPLISPEERDDKKVSVKLFVPLSTDSPSIRASLRSLSNALKHVHAELGCDVVESIILNLIRRKPRPTVGVSVAEREKEGSQEQEGGGEDGKEELEREGGHHERNTVMTLDQLKLYWKLIEDHFEQGHVLNIGLSDIDTDLFIELYNHSKIKPTIVQINLATCCVVPPLLSEFANNNSLQLLTHSDPTDLLPDAELQNVLSSSEKFQTKLREAVIPNGLEERMVMMMPTYSNVVSNVRLNWLFRYNVHVKCRGVLTSKGYVVSASAKADQCKSTA